MKKAVFLGMCLLSVLVAACASKPGTPEASPTVDLAAASPEFELEIKGDPHPLSMVPDVAIDAEGNVLTIDGNTIHKLDNSGQSLATWGEEGTGDGQFRFSCNTTDCAPGCWGGLDVDAQGNVYVADALNSRVQKLDSEGHFLASWGEEGYGDGQFYFPTDVAVDGEGNVFVCDSRREDIQKFDSEGRFLTKWSNQGATGTWAWWIATDEEGNVYAPNAESDEVRKFDGEGNLLETFGRRGSGDGEFRDPVAVAVDCQGNVYVVEDSGNRVQKFDREGNFLEKCGGGGRGSGEGQFSNPKGLAVGTDGTVYIADWGNSRIQKFCQQ
jgi:DNA-binding beta-propeller fold protein YncE